MHKEITLKDLYVEHLKDMYSAETQIIQALPNIIKTVEAPELKKALQQHLQETENHVTRIEQICDQRHVSPEGNLCIGMEGLLKETEEMMARLMASPDIMDSALIGECQKIENYEIRAYHELRDMAEMLADTNAFVLCTLSLEEEEADNEKLTHIGENILTLETVRATLSA